MDTYLPIFIAVTTFAILIQAIILIALYLAVRKTSARVEAVATDVRTKFLPALDTAQNLLTELRPQVQTVVANVQTVMGNVNQSSATVRAQLARMDATLNDIVDRARLQVIRVDELVSRTVDRVEETSDVVHRTVLSPVQKMSGLVQGVTAGIEAFVGGRRRRRGNGMGVPQDEMFI
jgi:methyl-accepting chemotaxis protein